MWIDEATFASPFARNILVYLGKSSDCCRCCPSQYADQEDIDFRPPQLTADGALASLEAMAGELRIESHERHLHDHLNSILDDRHKGVEPRLH